MIVARNRTYKRFKWKEYLVVSNNHVLILPQELPERYKNRILFQNNNYFEVDSKASLKPELYSKSAILNGQGVWLVKDDFEPKGEFIPCKIPGKSQFMGISIDDKACQTITELNKESSPYSVYHGTATENISNILSQGLRETHGMLGKAIYGAAFWKACRYASLGQNYVFRNGSVLRILLFSTNTKVLPSEGEACSCCLSPSNSKADHFTTWKNNGFDSVRALACSNAVGVCKDGSSKYILRNEEWGFSSDAIIITHYAAIDPSTQCAPHYDPLHRGTQIK
jgi:hypothetical protein